MNVLRRMLYMPAESRSAPDSIGGAEHDWRPGERAWLLGFAGLVVAATLVPVRQNWRPRNRRLDGFPLSYYPMFSKRRQATAKVAYGVGWRADGTRRFLPVEVLGEGGHNQVRHQLYRVAVREERPHDCLVEVLSRLPAHPELAELVRVEIVLGEFELNACMRSGRADGRETVLAGADLDTNRPRSCPTPPAEVIAGATA